MKDPGHVRTCECGVKKGAETRNGREDAFLKWAVVRFVRFVKLTDC